MGSVGFAADIEIVISPLRTFKTKPGALVPIGLVGPVGAAAGFEIFVSPLHAFRSELGARAPVGLFGPIGFALDVEIIFFPPSALISSASSSPYSRRSCTPWSWRSCSSPTPLVLHCRGGRALRGRGDRVHRIRLRLSPVERGNALRGRGDLHLPAACVQERARPQAPIGLFGPVGFAADVEIVISPLAPVKIMIELGAQTPVGILGPVGFAADVEIFFSPRALIASPSGSPSLR